MATKLNRDRLTWTVREAAEVLGVCENSLRERIRRGELPGVVRLGRRILISKSALMRFLCGKEEQNGESGGEAP